MMEASPPNPQDSSHSCHPRTQKTGARSPRPGLVWPRSQALGSHSCVALSSAEVSTSVPKEYPKTNSPKIESSLGQHIYSSLNSS
jgi:hypothetical protein